MLLFGPASVTEALGPITDLLAECGTAMAQDGGTKAERWAVAYLSRRARFIEAEGSLTAAMHKDVTRRRAA